MKKWNENDLLAAIQDGISTDWKNSDLHRGVEIALTRIATENYEGKEEDVEIILDHLNDDRMAGMRSYAGCPNGDLSLQDVEVVLYDGDTNYYCCFVEKMAKELNGYQLWFERNLLDNDYDTAGICKVGESPTYDYYCEGLANVWNELTGDNLDGASDVGDLYSGLWDEYDCFE
jgi:hypothetical protein